MKKYQYKVKGLDCAVCANKIEEMLKKRRDLSSVVLQFSLGKLSFASSEALKKEEIEKEIQKIEPSVTLEEEILEEENNRIDILRLIIGAALFSFSLMVPGIWKHIFCILSYTVLLIKTLKMAYYNLKGRILNENFLITISAIGAYLVGKSSEGFMVVFLYEIGKILENKAVAKSRKSITELMDLQAPKATLKRKNGYETVLPEMVEIGSIILVKKGEKIPLDGTLLDEVTEVDAKSLTGESTYQMKKKGDELLSGTINMKEAVHLKTTKKYEDSTASRILNLVENASEKKATTETFVSKNSRIYTPIVLILAILIAIFWPVFTNCTYKDSIYHALIFIVVACPCSIAISIPLAYFTGIGVLSRNGILVKGSVYLDVLRQLKRVVFDKTGTLTTGEFHIAKVLPEKGVSKKEILLYTGLGESFSDHPLAKAILKEIDQPLSLEKVENFQEKTGKGISYSYEGKRVKIGNDRFVKVNKKTEGTTLYLSIDDTFQGSIVLEDTIKQDAKETILGLKEKNIESYMFTGDKEEVAKRVAKEIRLDFVKAELLPSDKYQALEGLMQDGKLTAFVGDGMNDSPVLRRSDLGISMGGVGSSSAIEASDVVLMEDKPSKILDAMLISCFVNRIVIENLVFSLTIKLGTLIFSLFGMISMWQAVFADVGVTILTILNTLRILKKKH